MLAPDDAALAARHPALPGLRLLLDPEAVAEAAAGCLPELPVVGAEATYVRLKPGTSAVVGYRLALRDGVRLDAYARTSTTPDDPKLAKRLGTAAGAQPPSAVLLDRRTALLQASADPHLPALVRLLDPDRRPALLARALDRPPADGWGLQGLRHNPERRWVGRLVGPEGTPLLVKVHLPARHRRAVAAAEAFAAARVPAAHLVGSTRRHAMTVHGWVDGRSVVDALAPDGTAALHQVGALLARLHLGEVPRAARRLPPPPDEREELAIAVRAVAALDADAGAVAGALAARLGPRLDASPATADRPSLLHGDCSVDQVVLAACGPALIDLDRATCGDPHSDLAQVLADLALRQALDAVADDRPLAAALLDGYLAAGGAVDGHRLAALTATRLLRLAPEPFRRRHDRWAAVLQAVLERVGALAGGTVAA